MMEQPPNQKKSGRGGSLTMFPGRLHDLLEYVEAQGLDYIVSWVQDGKAFLVHQPDEFLKLLSFFFGQTKYRSFTRQLNMWHFERENYGPFKGAWYHPYFLRNNKELCDKMSRHEPPDRQVSGTPGILGANIRQLEDIAARPTLNIADKPDWFAAAMAETKDVSNSNSFNPSVPTYNLSLLFNDRSEILPERTDRNPMQRQESILGMNEFLSSALLEDSYSKGTPQHQQTTGMTGDDKGFPSRSQPPRTDSTGSLSALNESLFILEASNDALEPSPIAESNLNLSRRENFPADDEGRYLLDLLKNMP